MSAEGTPRPFRRLLTGGVTEKYKSQLLRVMARAGAVGEWQLEALRKSAERKSADSFEQRCEGCCK